MEDETTPQAARVIAEQVLLDRGWGKAPVQIDLNARQISAVSCVMLGWLRDTSMTIQTR
jgi:hypothetical protein